MRKGKGVLWIFVPTRTICHQLWSRGDLMQFLLPGLWSGFPPGALGADSWPAGEFHNARLAISERPNPSGVSSTKHPAEAAARLWMARTLNASQHQQPASRIIQQRILHTFVLYHIESPWPLQDWGSSQAIRIRYQDFSWKPEASLIFWPFTGWPGNLQEVLCGEQHQHFLHGESTGAGRGTWEGGRRLSRLGEGEPRSQQPQLGHLKPLLGLNLKLLLGILIFLMELWPGLKRWGRKPWLMQSLLTEWYYHTSCSSDFKALFCKLSF